MTTAYAPFSQSHAQWIWTAEGDYSTPAEASPSHYQVRYFRRAFQLDPSQTGPFRIHVSADTRFLLFLNGEFIGRGPCSGDVLHHYYESFELPASLLQESNALAAVVFDYSPVQCNPPKLGAPAAFPCHSGGFLLEMERDGTSILKTDASWKTAVDHAYRFHAEGNDFGAFIGYFEDLDLSALPEDWNQVSFDDGDWAFATELYPGTRLEQYVDAQGPYGLIEHEAEKPVESPLPGDERERAVLPGGESAPENWQAFFQQGQAITLDVGTTTTVILPLAREWTGFPRLAFKGGSGSTVRLRYAEALRLPKETENAAIFGADQSTADVSIGWSDDSTGWTFDTRGKLSGYCDIIRPDGRAFTYEPHHFRTFKYIQMEVSVAEDPLTLTGLELHSTGYPLDNRAAFQSSSEELNRIYEISWHTLRLSAHETYFDCPYYEQLQYVTDGYINMLNTLIAAGETKLPRQFVEQIGWSLNHEGLVWCRYPSRIPGFIPGQCLEWIASLHDFVLHSGDVAFARQHSRHLYSILDFFAQRIGSRGLPEALPWWNWIDWCPGWKRGVPPGAEAGPVLSLCAKYTLALDQATSLAEWSGEEAASAEYARRRDAAREALNRVFWNEADGRYAENVTDPAYASQLGNAFAVLAGAPDAGKARCLTEAFTAGDMTPASYMGMFFIRLARAKLGCYSIDNLCQPYREMLDYGLSTWAEDTCYWRSLCHGYSAHPIVDCVQIVLGLQVDSPGGRRISARPMVDVLERAEGCLPTPRGHIVLAWDRSGHDPNLSIEIPEGTELSLYLPNDKQALQLGGGRHSFPLEAVTTLS